LTRELVINAKTITPDKINFANVNYKIKTANCTPLKLLGNALIIIKIGDIELTHHFLVIDKLYSPTLDWFRYYKKIKNDYKLRQ